MNFINKSLLGLALLPRPLYKNWGIDVSHLTAILTTKLMMDDRRPNTIQATRQHKSGQKEISNATLGTMLLSAFMGLLYLSVFALGSDYITQLTLYFSLFIAMLCMVLVSDFTAVLIDVRDNYIILPKPVNDRTFVVARLLHIFIHMCKLVVPMLLPCIVYLAITANIAASFIFLTVAFFAILLSIFLINAVYIIILRITTPERFKTIISYVQIGFAILVYGSSLILPRMLGEMDLASFEVLPYKWLVAAPPYWFACAFNILFTGHGTPEQWVAATLAIVGPLVSVYIVVKFLAPAFNQKLAMISGGESAPVPSAGAAANLQGENGLAEKISALLTTGKTERAGFLFTWKMMARSRDFKVRVYPSIGYFVVILVMFFLNGRRTSDMSIEEFTYGFRPVVAVYFSGLILLTAVGQMLYSEKFKAAWVFYVAPIQQPGHLLSGALKAAIVQFYGMVALVILTMGLWLAGPAMLPNLLLALVNQLVINYAVVVVNSKQLPFAQSSTDIQKGGQLMRSLFLMFISGCLGVIHFFLFQHLIAIGIAFVLSVIGLWLLMESVRRTSWKEMRGVTE